MNDLKIYFPITFDIYTHWRGGYNLAFGALKTFKRLGAEIIFVHTFPNIPIQPDAESIGPILRFENTDLACDALSKIQTTNNILFSLGPCMMWPTLMKKIIYIPDFQHEYLTENFSTDELRIRRHTYYLESKMADAVWVSSYSVSKDFHKFIGIDGRKILLLPFPTLKEKPKRLSTAERKKQILCVSQNWKHKNLDFLCKVWNRVFDKVPGWELIIVGTKTQSLHPPPASQILSEVSEQILENLYLQSSAFILPSDFEGWSTPVEEAIAAGLPLFLNDLPIFREQAGSAAHFFDVSQSASVEDELIQSLNSPSLLSQMKDKTLAIQRPSREVWAQNVLNFFKEIKI